MRVGKAGAAPRRRADEGPVAGEGGVVEGVKLPSFDSGKRGIRAPSGSGAFAVDPDGLRWVEQAASRFEAGASIGKEANMAKMLASEASWAAAEICLQAHGGFGFAEEYDVERKWREARLYQVAPISTNMILAYIAEHVLGLPRSY